MDDVIETHTRPSFAAHAQAMTVYGEEGLRRAVRIGNKGPMRFGADGRLHPDIIAAYWQHGYYVFEGVIAAAEVDELRRDAAVMLDRAPVSPGSSVDRQGRPALGRDAAREPYFLVKPLSDPTGGTDVNSGRHPSRMAEPVPDADAPSYVVHRMRGMCEYMPAGLRVYGHPQLLAAAASINGDDFVPFNDVIFVKQPGVGGSVAWHQDGVTHWNAPDWDEGIHGFNYQVQLYPTTAANALWVVPGSHKRGHADIRRMVSENGGSDRLPDALPLICAAGDVTMVNRQTVHGSFANTSPDMRVSITFGFHRRRSVLGAKAALSMAFQNVTYDEARIARRASVIAVAIEARRRYYPQEQAFTYQPFAGHEAQFRHSEAELPAVLHDYNLDDLAI
jgi:ectoine hydroxylase-related dioxygenase (phytanoyl-CoA dioxygenase family)